MWEHWPGLLIVLDDIELSEATNDGITSSDEKKLHQYDITQ